MNFLLIAALSVNSIFSNHMVLQRDRPVPVWGRGDAGEEVAVAFAGQTVKATVGADGRWRAMLAAMKESNESRDFVVAMGKEKKTFKDVLVGDVWICSGQSNMEFPFASKPYGCEEARTNLANATNIRTVRVQRRKQNVPREDAPVGGGWRQVTGETFNEASCVACFFALAVREKTEGKIPLGLINSSWGGMNIEPYINPDVLCEGQGQYLKSISDRYDQSTNPKTEKGKATWAKYIAALKEWTAACERGVAAGEVPVANIPEVPCTHGYWWGCWQAMVYPYRDFPVKGALWYQGCGNMAAGYGYQQLLETLFSGWRKAWGYEFPCYWVQLSTYNAVPVDDQPKGGCGYATVREGMRRALATVPKSGMAVTIDVGNPKDIHPKEKRLVGERLAKIALKNDYGFKDIVAEGPTFKSMTVADGKARLEMDGHGAAIAAGQKDPYDGKDVTILDAKELKGFAIAGADKKWFFADAVIDGDAIVVSSKDVPQPVAVRYAYRTSPVGANLYNRAGIPASPFKTDDWDEKK